MRLVRRYVQDERESDGAVHGNSMVPKLRKAFQKSGGRKVSDTDWLQHIHQGSNKMRFHCCMNRRNSLLHVRAIQGLTGESLMAPELMGHVAISYEWKEFLFHRGCSSTVNSILALLEDEKAKKEGHLLHTSQPIRGQSRRRRT